MKETTLHVLKPEIDNSLPLPYADGGIKAGFPSPAQDYIVDSIDLNQELIHHKECTFYARVQGNSMTDAGINDGDIVVVDRSIEPSDGNYIVGYLDDGFTLKQYKLDPKNNCAWLIPANPEFQPIKVTEDNQFIIWGVVTYVIRKLR